MKPLREIVEAFVGQPHDGFHKDVFGDVPVYCAVIERAFDAERVALMKLDKLERVPASYVDEGLSQRHADLLVRVPLLANDEDDEEGAAVLYMVSEHLRSPDNAIVSRMHTYFAQVLRAHAKSSQSDPEHVTHASAAGLVLYNGRRPWRLATGSGATPSVAAPFSVVQVVDVQRLAETPFDRESLPDVAAQLGLLLLGNTGTQELVRVIEENAELFRALVADPHYRLHHFPLHLIYIGQTTEAGMAEAAINRLEELVPETKQGRRTLYEAYRDRFLAEGRSEGLSRGLEEGHRTGRAEGAEEGVRAALRTVLSARGLELSPGQARRIDACADVDQLTRWLELSATASSLDEVLE